MIATAPRPTLPEVSAERAAAFAALVNADAEQALLGALLLDNRTFQSVETIIQASHFGNALHGRIFDAIGTLVKRGQSANPITLKSLFDQDAALATIGGAKYLAQLATSAALMTNAPDYAYHIADLSCRRSLIMACEDAIHAAITVDLSRPAASVAAEHVSRITELNSTTPNAGRGRIEVVNGMELVPRPIDWLWKGYLARGKLHVLAGAKGAGKTTIIISLAAAFTKGGRLPDGTKAPIGDVLMWSGEDDAADSLLPRLIASGGDRTRINFICGFKEGDGKRRAFDPSRDFPSLIEATKSLPELVLIIIDPIVSAVAGDSHKNAETRRGLQPIVDLVSATHAAGFGLTHFTKGTAGRDPIDRINGSLAFGALPRVLFGAAKPVDQKAKRRFVRVASNIGPEDGGFEYTLAQELPPDLDFEAQRVVWGAELDGDARTLLREIEDDDESAGSKMKQASAWLSDALAAGPVAVVELEADAKAEGIAWRTIKRAKRANGIIATKDGDAGGWRWRLPQ